MHCEKPGVQLEDARSNRESDRMEAAAVVDAAAARSARIDIRFFGMVRIFLSSPFIFTLTLSTGLRSVGFSCYRRRGAKQRNTMEVVDGVGNRHFGRIEEMGTRWRAEASHGGQA